MLRAFRFFFTISAILLIVPICANTGALFRLTVSAAGAIQQSCPALLFGLPFAGLVIVGLYRLARLSIHDDRFCLAELLCLGCPYSFWHGPLVFISAAITHLFGGSAGCEGSSFLLGGALASPLQKFFANDDAGFRLLTLCAMSSCFAPLLGTPLTAAFYVIEMTRQPRLVPLIICVAASQLAIVSTQWAGIEPFAFSLAPLEIQSVKSFWLISLTTFLFAIIGVLFNHCMFVSRYYFAKIPSAYGTIFFGGAIVVAITVIFSCQSCCGLGWPTIREALAGNATYSEGLWKIVLTSITMGVGYKGGQIVPSFFVGAVLGCSIATAFGLDAQWGAALGLIAAFASVVQCPCSAMVLSLEAFGESGFPLFLTTCLFVVLLRKAFHRWLTPEVLKVTYGKV